MNHHFQCDCGALQGQIHRLDLALRGVCYCHDCRAYSRHLGRVAQVHDAYGGVGFVATQAHFVSLLEGEQNLACLSLSPKGALRWYAKCCNSPIANTTRHWRFPYVGFVHTCLNADQEAFEQAFPAVQMRANTGSARQAPPAQLLGTAAALLGFVPRVLLSGVNGAYKQTPFFNSPKGTPSVDVHVLTPQERQRAYGMV